MRYSQHNIDPKTGWTEWICPKMSGYRMKCCDCGLVHDVDFRVVKYKHSKSCFYKVIRGKNTQVHIRVRRNERCTSAGRRTRKAGV